VTIFIILHQSKNKQLMASSAGVTGGYSSFYQ